jgi:hypothetical protein
MKSNLLSLAALAAVTVLAGCGGASGMPGGSSLVGGGGPAMSAASAGSVHAFATSTPQTRFGHVWVRVFTIDLKSSAGTVATVFSEPSGRIMDLTSLQDASGSKFAFLNKVALPTGSFTSASITFAKAVTVVGKTATRGIIRQFNTSMDIPNVPSRSKLTFALNPALAVTGANQPVALDFNVQSWSILSTGKVQPFMRKAPSSATPPSPARQEPQDFHGAIGSIAGTAPDFTFTLSHGSNLPLNVATDVNTVIFNENGAANPVLTNGERVEVTGVLANGVLQASTIKIDNEDANEAPAEARGVARNLDATAGTFTLTIARARGFVPSGTTLNVITNASSVFMDGTGAVVTEAQFFAALAAAPAGTGVEVEGTVDGSGNFTAVKLKLEDEAENETGGDDHHGGSGGTTGGGSTSGGGGTDDGTGHN